MPAPKDPIKYAEWIKKLSVANKKRTGEKSANYGKRFSEEWKRKIGESCKGKHVSEETKHKISEGLKGRTFSEEHRNNLSKALKGNPKLSMAQKGKPKSEEHRRKLSEARIGKYRGEQSPFYGIPKSEEHRRKLSDALKGKYPGEKSPMYGRHHTEEAKKKISEAHTGMSPSEETKHKLSLSLRGANNPRYGCHLTEETKKKISEARMGKYKGEMNPNWRGGVSFEPYCIKFNKEFKERVREFFGRRCVECNKFEDENGDKLSVHHINYDKMVCCNDTTPLFVALCRSCHSKTQVNRDHWYEYFDNLINTKYNGKCFYTKEEMNSNANPIP